MTVTLRAVGATPGPNEQVPAWPAEELEAVDRCPLCGCADRKALHQDLTDRVFFCAPGRWSLYRRAGGPFTNVATARALILIPGRPWKASRAPIVRITRTSRKAKRMPLQAPSNVSSECRIMATSMRSITLT